MNDEKKGETLSELWTEIGFSCAFLCIKLGDLDYALRLIDWTLDMQHDGEDETAQSQAWFLYGLRDLAICAGNEAIYSFLQTLWEQPDHTGADEAVDEMEFRRRSSTELTERIILHNVQPVLQPFRHRTHDSAVMSEDGHELLLQQWYAGEKEMGLHWLSSL